jgi:dihydrophenazinedicarboxylate synthase
MSAPDRQPEFDAPPPDPLALLRAWLQAAEKAGALHPLAAVLATAPAAGAVSSRVVIVKDVDARGLVFASSRASRKGRDLATSPQASLTFHWRETHQQVNAQGLVEVMTAEESDALFAPRPRLSQAAAAVSRQSSPLDDEEGLWARACALAESEGPIARPAEWTGYRLVPCGIEFWQGSDHRLHRRLRYDRAEEGAPWSTRRLQP